MIFIRFYTYLAHSNTYVITTDTLEHSILSYFIFTSKEKTTERTIWLLKQTGSEYNIKTIWVLFNLHYNESEKTHIKILSLTKSSYGK